MAMHKHRCKLHFNHFPFRLIYSQHFSVSVACNIRDSFLRREHDNTYGTKNHNVDLMWFVYGYPKPKMTYYFNDQIVESGGRFDFSYTRNGQATLFINK